MLPGVSGSSYTSTAAAQSASKWASDCGDRKSVTYSCLGIGSGTCSGMRSVIASSATSRSAPSASADITATMRPG